MERSTSNIETSESSLPLIATRNGRTLNGVTARRISWQEFWRERPDRKPANDNDCLI